MSEDDVVDFCVAEAVALRVAALREEAQKEQERKARWRSKLDEVKNNPNWTPGAG